MLPHPTRFLACLLPQQPLAQVVYNNCFTFPRKLIFFLLGTFRHSYLGYVTGVSARGTPGRVRRA